MLNCFYFVAIVEEEEEAPQEGTSSKVSPSVMEIFDSPPKMDKGKRLAIPESSRLEREAPIAADAIGKFMRQQARRSKLMRG